MYPYLVLYYYTVNMIFYLLFHNLILLFLHLLYKNYRLLKQLFIVLPWGDLPNPQKIPVNGNVVFFSNREVKQTTSQAQENRHQHNQFIHCVTLTISI